MLASQTHNGICCVQPHDQPSTVKVKGWMADTCSLAGSAVADGIPAGASPDAPAGTVNPNSDMDVYESSKDVQTSLMWMAGLPEVMELLDGGVAARPAGAVGDAGKPEDPEKAAGMRGWRPVMTP